MKTRKIRGQVSIEYMILLSVVLIMVMVVAGFMMGFISWGQTSEERASKNYWRTTEVGIVVWSATGGAGTASLSCVIQNNKVDTIEIIKIKVDEKEHSPTDLELIPGGKSEEQKVSGLTCKSGDTYNWDVTITYKVYDVELKFRGAEPLVGTCA